MTEELPHEQPYDLQDNTKCYDTGKDEKKEASLKTIAEWNKEQETKKQQGISVSEALRLHNENATVRGMIVSISQPFKMVTAKIVICENESWSNKQTKIYDKPRFSVPDVRKQRDCPQCNNTEFNIDFVYTTAVNIKLQDDRPYGELEQLDVLLFGNDTMNIRPGEIVKVTGHIGVEQNNGKGKLYAIMYAESIKYEQRQELEVTAKDILSLKKFAKMPNVIERLVSMVASDVIGHRDKKLGILRSAVGSPETDRKRGRIHTLLIGPPGLAKSMLARGSNRNNTKQQVCNSTKCKWKRYNCYY